MLAACEHTTPEDPAGSTEQSRAEAMPHCNGIVHDDTFYTDCVIRGIVAAPDRDSAEELCSSLPLRQSECRSQWAMRMMNRADAEDVRIMCGEDGECLAELEEVIAWRAKVQPPG